MYNKINKIFSPSLNKILGLTCFLILLLSSVFFNLPVKSEALIYSEGGINAKNSIHLQASPGESISSLIEIYNVNNKSANYTIGSQDLLVTQEGTFTLQSENYEPKEAGSWIELENKNIAIDAKKSAKIPFKLNVPENTKPGEYLGGIYVINNNDDENSTIKTKIRKAIRIYVLVKGEEDNYSVEIKNPEIVNPSNTDSQDFQNLSQKYPFFGKNNLMIKTPLAASGNRFVKVKIDYEVTNSEYTFNNSVEYIIPPRETTIDYYIITQQRYVSGENKVKMNYEVYPLYNYEEEDFNTSIISQTDYKETTLNLYPWDLIGEDTAKFDANNKSTQTNPNPINILISWLPWIILPIITILIFIAFLLKKTIPSSKKTGLK